MEFQTIFEAVKWNSNTCHGPCWLRFMPIQLIWISNTIFTLISILQSKTYKIHSYRSFLVENSYNSQVIVN